MSSFSFYDINKKLNSISEGSTPVNESVAKQEKPLTLLERALRTELNKEDGTGGLNASGAGSLQEKWAGDVKLNPEKKGMFKGKTKADLEKQLANLKKTGPHKKGSKEYTKQQELNFAIRAKSGWKEDVNEASSAEMRDYFSKQQPNPTAPAKVYQSPQQYQQQTGKNIHAVPNKAVGEAAKWRDPKYKGQLFTQEPEDSEEGWYDTRLNTMYDKPRPENDPGEKKRIGGVRDEFHRGWDDPGDPLQHRHDYSRGSEDPENWGYGSISSKGPRKGMLTKQAMNTLKNRIKDTHHTEPNLPEGVPMTLEDETVPNKAVGEAAKWRDPKYKGQLFTQKKGDSDDYDSIDYGYGIKERPKKDPGQKRSTFDRDTVWTDPLDTRSNLPKHHNDPESWGYGSISSKGDSKGKLTADRRKRMKNDIRGSLGQHHTPNLPEGVPMTLEDENMMNYLKRKSGKPAHAGIEFEDGPHGKPQWLIDAQKRAEKNAGKNVEVDEAVSRKHFQAIADTLKHIENPEKRRELAHHHASQFKLANPRFDHDKFMKACGLEECDVGGPMEETAWDYKSPRDAQTTGKFDSKKTSTGTVYTRKPETFSDEPGADSSDGAKRGRGRPAKSTSAPRVTKGAWKNKQEESALEETCPHCGGAMSHKGEMDEEKVQAGKRHFFDKLAPAAKKVAKVVNKITKSKDSKEPVEEKAVSKKQQKFMGMVHAAQKGEKPASKEVAKVAKGMKKKDVEDFASTKHKGLPEKAKSKKEESAKPDFVDLDKDGDKKEPMKKAAKDAKKPDTKKSEKKVEETTTGSVATAPSASKGGMSVGKGIYDSINRAVEQMISESFNINTNNTVDETGENKKSITVTAEGNEADMLAELLKNAGLDGQSDHQAHDEHQAHDDMSPVPHEGDELSELLKFAGIDGGSHHHEGEYCPSCGNDPCECSDEEGQPGVIDFEIDESQAPVTENDPDWPTNPEGSEDAMQYSGGLNGPKATGQTTGSPLPVQHAQHVAEERSIFDLYKAIESITK